MPIFEVTYEIKGETASVLVEAPTPVEAARRFQAEQAEPGATVVCVVRQ